MGYILVYISDKYKQNDTSLLCPVNYNLNAGVHV